MLNLFWPEEERRQGPIKEGDKVFVASLVW
jgi:hypothetical protein